MNDRISLYPGRVTLTPVAGQENTYDMVRADQPTQEGTPLSKANLLTDETEVSLFGYAANRTVNQAFESISFRFSLLTKNMASLTVTVTDSNGLAAKGVEVQGMVNEAGAAVNTDSSGVARGYVSAGNVRLKISGYADIVDAEDTFTATAGGTYTRSITVVRRTFLKILSSANYRFSSNVATVDVSVGAAGAGGSYATCPSAWVGRGGQGGGDGSVSVQTGIAPDKNKVYSAVVGAGGEPANPGGSSSFMGVVAAGGAVNGGGVGAYVKTTTGTATASAAGAPGTGSLYESETETILFGGQGGGGGCAVYMTVNGTYLGGYPGSDGGDPGGGDGAGKTMSGLGAYSEASAGEDGSGSGGGGGLAIRGYDSQSRISFSSTTPGRGGSGCITVRMHLAA